MGRGDETAKSVAHFVMKGPGLSVVLSDVAGKGMEIAGECTGMVSQREEVVEAGVGGERRASRTLSRFCRRGMREAGGREQRKRTQHRPSQGSRDGGHRLQVTRIQPHLLHQQIHEDQHGMSGVDSQQAGTLGGQATAADGRANFASKAGLRQSSVRAQRRTKEYSQRRPTSQTTGSPNRERGTAALGSRGRIHGPLALASGVKQRYEPARQWRTRQGRGGRAAGSLRAQEERAGRRGRGAPC